MIHGVFRQSLPSVLALTAPARPRTKKRLPMSFRDNLQHLRAERDMTQEQLAALFAPRLSASDPASFEPEGTSVMWFWAAWPIGGMVCGIISLLWNTFGKDC